LFSVIRCTKTEVENPENKIEVLTGYIAIEDNTLYFYQVEIVEMEGKEREWKNLILMRTICQMDMRLLMKFQKKNL